MSVSATANQRKPSSIEALRKEVNDKITRNPKQLLKSQQENINHL